MSIKQAVCHPGKLLPFDLTELSHLLEKQVTLV